MIALDVSDLVGIPFRTGGRDAATGLGCWGIVREVLSRMGLSVYDPWEILATAGSQSANPGFFDAVMAGMEGRWDDVTACEKVAGDVAILDSGDGKLHAGVVLDGGQFIHTTMATGCVLARWSSIAPRAVAVYRVRPC